MVADVSRPYRVQHLADVPAALSPNSLACVLHGTDRRPDDDPRWIPVRLPLLSGPQAELWHSDRPVDCGWDEGLGFARNGEVLFGQIEVPETELENLDRAVFHAYVRIEQLLRRHGYPAWLRMWNYIGDINRGEGDHERYRQFVVGRYKALALKPGFERELPAATAIGMRGGGLQVYFLAGRVSGQQVENPRQVSAFQYPRQYGPRSPSFSRAMLMRWAGMPELLVSGTASVVGHETLHVGEPLRQLRESISNVHALLQQADEMAGARLVWEPQACKLYLRDADAAQVRAAVDLLTTHIPRERIVALQGDICRTDLGVEMDALYSAQARAA